MEVNGIISNGCNKPNCIDNNLPHFFCKRKYAFYLSSVGSQGLLQVPKMRDRQVGVSFFSQITSNKGRGHSLELYHARFKLDMRKKFSSERVVKHCNMLPRENEITILGRCVDVAHGDIV